MAGAPVATSVGIPNGDASDNGEAVADPAAAATTTQPPSAYRPTEHGMVTADFLADFLDTLGMEDNSDSDPDREDVSELPPLQLRNDYIAKQATDAHFALPWYAEAEKLDLENAACLQMEQHDPSGPARVRWTIDYLFYGGEFASAERLCHTWVDQVLLPPKHPKRRAASRIAAYREIAEIGLRCAYRLRLLGRACWYYSLLQPIDGNMSYLLGTFHLHFPEVYFPHQAAVAPDYGSLVTGSSPPPAPPSAQALLHHLVATATYHRRDDPAAWIAVRELLLPSPSALLSLLGAYAHVRAQSILECARVNPHAARSTREAHERKHVELRKFPLRHHKWAWMSAASRPSNETNVPEQDPCAKRTLVYYCVAGRRIHDTLRGDPANIDGHYNADSDPRIAGANENGEQLQRDCANWNWKQLRTEFPPEWRTLERAAESKGGARGLFGKISNSPRTASDMSENNSLQHPRGAGESEQRPIDPALAACLHAMYEHLVRGACRRASPTLWACARAGILDLSDDIASISGTDPGDGGDDEGGARNL